jgi:hypothetical protein
MDSTYTRPFLLSHYNFSLFVSNGPAPVNDEKRKINLFKIIEYNNTKDIIIINLLDIIKQDCYDSINQETFLIKKDSALC